MASNRFTTWVGKHLVAWNAALAVVFLSLAIAQLIALATGDGRPETKMFVVITMLISCAGSTTVAISLHTQKRRSGETGSRGGGAISTHDGEAPLQ